LSTIVLEKSELLFPGLKQPQNKGDRLLLQRFLLKLSPEMLESIEDEALRRAYILAHVFLVGEELKEATEKLIPALSARGLPLDLGQFAVDRELSSVPQEIESLSDNDLISLHGILHETKGALQTDSPLCEIVCLLDALANLLRRFI